ncbi:type I-E CRISPR-associated endonuclease Cas1e [Oceanidesulfovibrio marinus]|uniref:CRISPR-associated endonuclease Cas1 n=1 Tax=Oceanidesulfovibrio marinus TaxID=370038 RepID=A0ABX6NCQ3_9BACT|nr:type I-E CRISPR-associated endonuclease Cas1e [Oceanidesulfovibrio marinus]QJT08021.1 type I-E CRISPR-associated endonuclease Cas1 [Oceanidesulfovibrio marinus]
MLPPLKPIPMKERLSLIFLERCRLDVKDGAFVAIDKEGIRTHVPVGGVVCIMLEPGTRVSHAAVALAARSGTLLVWTGEGGVRMYAAGQPGGARSDKLLYQASLALDPAARLKVVKKMFAVRFNESAPDKRSVEQLRGIEGARVRSMYDLLAKQHRVTWKRRAYDPKNWDTADPVNKALSAATASLYGVTEAAVLAAGYAPAIGFLHTGKPLSFVYDIADLFKFETVVPVAFKEVSKGEFDVEGRVRRACRDVFRTSKLLKRIIPVIEEVLAAGDKEPPPPYEDAVGPAFRDEEGIGDDGHRS